MPLSHEINTQGPYGSVRNHHNIKVNQNLIRELKSEVKDISQGQASLKEDIDKMNEKINFIYNYIVQKKEKEDARWF